MFIKQLNTQKRAVYFLLEKGYEQTTYEQLVKELDIQGHFKEKADFIFNGRKDRSADLKALMIEHYAYGRSLLKTSIDVLAILVADFDGEQDYLAARQLLIFSSPELYARQLLEIENLKQALASSLKQLDFQERSDYPLPESGYPVNLSSADIFLKKENHQLLAAIAVEIARNAFYQYSQTRNQMSYEDCIKVSYQEFKKIG